MTTNVKAIYEHGVFKPSEPVPLKEGTPVEVILPIQQTASNESPAQILSRIASHSKPTTEDGFSGEDHDDVLYGPKSA